MLLLEKWRKIMLPITVIANKKITRENLADLAGLHESITLELLIKVLGEKDSCYLLHWTGDIMPAGVKIEDRKITWTQHGLVYAEKLLDISRQEVIGSYERLLENEQTREHIIVIYLDEVDDENHQD